MEAVEAAIKHNGKDQILIPGEFRRHAGKVTWKKVGAEDCLSLELILILSRKL